METRATRRLAAILAAVLLLAAGAWLVLDRALLPATGDQAAPTQAAAPAESDRPMMVVLPFANLSADPNQEYFSDGISEDITTALSRFPGFMVIARNSAFAYKGRPVNAQQIGRELGVRHALEGGVQKQGDRLRLNAQLVDTQTGAQVWAETFDRPLADIFVVQDELADRIVGSVAINRQRREGEKALAAPPETLEAYDLTMRARLLIRQRGDRESSLEARRALESAIERDPSYAQAHAYLAITLDRFRVNRWTDEYATAAVAERGLAASARAVSLAPNDAITHAMHGRLLAANGQFDAALAAADAALALGPDDADTIIAAATIMRRSGRFAETVDLIRRAMKLDPYIDPGGVGTTMGLSLYALGRYAEAGDAARYCIARAPAAQTCRQMLAATLAMSGREPEAREAGFDLLRVAPGFTIAALVQQMLPANRNAADVEHFADGLRKAGLPE